MRALIIRELAAAKAAEQAAGPEPWEPATLAQEAIARVLFPITLGTGVAALRAEEVLCAVWLLHEGFELGGDTVAEADRAMSMVAAITYGVHQAAGMAAWAWTAPCPPRGDVNATITIGRRACQSPQQRRSGRASVVLDDGGE